MGGAVSTHSRPKAAARVAKILAQQGVVSTHSRPKAAAADGGDVAALSEFQLTAARRRLRVRLAFGQILVKFQLTAARRRLPSMSGNTLSMIRFNSQPPEGGCFWSGFVFCY